MRDQSNPECCDGHGATLFSQSGVVDVSKGKGSMALMDIFGLEKKDLPQVAALHHLHASPAASLLHPLPSLSAFPPFGPSRALSQAHPRSLTQQGRRIGWCRWCCFFVVVVKDARGGNLEYYEIRNDGG